eukprot:TRINITY_DN2477_c0_g2_i6.p1 TRINITY_DN2477_c0_g2~~TRINITY_DN2477_c0_g2_i6.p1  ORF type:complete len:407 (+),score=60.61 TRINITY_DN2477_c0_g2_i6:100-1221(+)
MLRSLVGSEMCIRDSINAEYGESRGDTMGNLCELGSTSLGTEFIAELDPHSRRQLAMASRGLRAAVESAREDGQCAVARLVRLQGCFREKECSQVEELDWDDSDGNWRVIGSSRAPRHGEFTLTPAGRFLYWIGGWARDDMYSGSVEVLDTATGTWSTTERLHPGRRQHSCTLVRDLLYVVGGCIKGYSPCTPPHCLKLVELLDVHTGTWSSGEPLDAPRRAHASVLVGDLLYVSGGIGYTSSQYLEPRVLNSVEVLDTVAGTWSTAPPMPTARYGHICALVGDLLYVIGGEVPPDGGRGSKFVDAVEVFNTVTGTWSTVAPLGDQSAVPLSSLEWWVRWDRCELISDRLRSIGASPEDVDAVFGEVWCHYFE